MVLNPTVQKIHWPPFHEAVRVHADGIELDVHLSLDNELIVIHDEKIDRTTNGKGPVKNMNAIDLRKFDAGSCSIQNLLTKKFQLCQRF